MYILLVSRGYPSEKYKMNGIFEFDQAKALKKSGHEVIYVAIDVRSIRRWRKWGLERKRIEGIEVYVINIPCGRIPKQLRNKIKAWGLTKLYKLINKEHGRPDIIHAHFIENGFIVAKVFSDFNIPLILTEHYSAMNQKILSSYYKKLGRFTYSRMNKVLAVSDHLANNIKEKFDVDTIVVPNVVDLLHFDYYKYHNNKNKNRFIFVSVGGLQQIKRMDVLINAFHAVFRNKKDVKLYIFGEGPERNKLQKIIDTLGIEEQVYLMGLVDRKIIAEQMSKSDCFVLVSESETFGVAYVEALAMGLPVIATKCGGPEGFINEQNGMLVPIDSNEKLEEALKNMHQQIHQYNKDLIAEETRCKYSEENVINNLLEIYQELIDQGRPN